MAVAYDRKGPGLTRAEYDELGRRGVLDDARVELLEGRIVPMSPLGGLHVYSVSELMNLLVRAVGDRARVRVQAPLAANHDSEPEPDVAVVAYGDYLEEHPRTAHLVVEVADSSLARDRAKARLYAAARVAEYWIVNLKAEAIEVHRDPQGETYASVTRHVRGDTVRLVSFTDVELRVSDILPPVKKP